MTCRVSGRPDPEISWYKAGKLVTEDTRHKVRKSKQAFFCKKSVIMINYFDPLKIIKSIRVILILNIILSENSSSIIDVYFLIIKEVVL